ncbi:dof zinc finger protein DOF3.7-like [Hibiscus syriacus]|nr:dof zinc finger protein DOF3.7-like [Hibiscus syriacus]
MAYLNIYKLVKVENNADLQRYSSTSALEPLRTGVASRGLNSFRPAPALDSTTTPCSIGFYMQDYNPTLGFSINRLENQAACTHGIQENGGKVLFPFGEMESSSSSTDGVDDQNKEQGNSAGYWTD